MMFVLLLLVLPIFHVDAVCNATIDYFTPTALNQGLRMTIGSYQGAFGEQIVNSMKSSVHIRSHGAILPNVETFASGGGACTASTENYFLCSSGTATSAFSVLRSIFPAVYHPGESIIGRFTIALPTPCSEGNCLVAGGLFTTTDGLLIGLKNNVFSVGYQHHGQVEQRTLTISVAASSASTATVTVSGTAVIVSLTVSTAATNAFEIATALAANPTLGATYYFEQVASTVLATGRYTDEVVGAFSYAAGTTGSTAAWTQQAAALPKTEQWIGRTSMDGYSDITWLNETSMNIYQVIFGFLGVANIQYQVMNPNLGSFQTMHTIQIANTQTGVSVRNPNFKVGWIASRGASGSVDYKIIGGSGQVARVEIFDESIENTWSANVERTGVTAAAQAYGLALRNLRTLNGNLNNGLVRILTLSAGTDSTKGAVVRIIRQCTLTGTPNWAYVSQGQSIVSYDTSATACTGGSVVYTGNIGGSGSLAVDLSTIAAQIPVNQIIAVTLQVVSGAASEVDASITWSEDF